MINASHQLSHHVLRTDRRLYAVSENRPRGHINNHQVHGLRRLILQCFRCRVEDEIDQHSVDQNTGRAKALLEHLQGARTFPQTMENLTVQQCSELFNRGERLHPFRSDSVLDIGLITNSIDTQIAQSNHPLAAQIPIKWRECVERQRRLDSADHFPSTADQQLSLRRIREDLLEFTPQSTLPPSPPRENPGWLWILYLLGRRLHPYPQGSRFIGAVTLELNVRIELHPENASFLAHWEECQRRQTEIDNTDRTFAIEDLEFRLSEIPGYDKLPQPPVSLDDYFDREVETNSDRSSSEEERFATPITFSEWMEHNNDWTSREAPRSADYDLSEDVNSYSLFPERL